METEVITTKEFWREFGIFIGIILFFFMSLFGLIKLSQKSWDEGLKASVQAVLAEKTTEKWVLGNKIYLNSPIASSAALYELRKQDSVEKNYAIIIRSATFYGHIPAVYIYNKNEGVKFIGYSSVTGKIRKLLDQGKSDSSITQWSRRIPDIVKIAEGGRTK
ncbi:MAG: hypothetical protein IJL70_06455 [Treponema sp.]|nr:hypothetical protein [Treponema sp.]